MKEKNFKFELGDTLQDKISKFKGIVVGRTDFITGCNRYLLQPKCKNSNEYLEAIEIDETTLIKIKTIKQKIKKINNGGRIKIVNRNKIMRF